MIAGISGIQHLCASILMKFKHLEVALCVATLVEVMRLPHLHFFIPYIHHKLPKGITHTSMATSGPTYLCEKDSTKPKQ